MQRMIAAGLLAVGVFVLFGIGWALLTAGALLWMRDDRAAAWMAGRWAMVQAGVRNVALNVRTAPRKSVAASAMGAGLAVTPAGVAVTSGVGMALVVGGVLLVGFSLLTGWGA